MFEWLCRHLWIHHSIVVVENGNTEILEKIVVSYIPPLFFLGFAFLFDFYCTCIWVPIISYRSPCLRIIIIGPEYNRIGRALIHTLGGASEPGYSLWSSLFQRCISLITMGLLKSTSWKPVTLAPPCMKRSRLMSLKPFMGNKDKERSWAESSDGRKTQCNQKNTLLTAVVGFENDWWWTTADML